jgi:hypothetical protein
VSPPRLRERLIGTLIVSASLVVVHVGPSQPSIRSACQTGVLTPINRHSQPDARVIDFVEVFAGFCLSGAVVGSVSVPVGGLGRVVMAG